MSSGYAVEMLLDEEVFEVQAQIEGQPIEVLIPPGSKVLEVFTAAPSWPVQIGGTNPASNPAILVWFDTQGAR